MCRIQGNPLPSVGVQTAMTLAVCLSILFHYFLPRPATQRVVKCESRPDKKKGRGFFKMTTPTLKRQRLQEILDACVRLGKSDDGEFSAKWLHESGVNVSGRQLTELCKLGCLSFRANGIDGQGLHWYRVLRSMLPAAL
jgi:hypothetical protein